MYIIYPSVEVVSTSPAPEDSGRFAVRVVNSTFDDIARLVRRGALGRRGVSRMHVRYTFRLALPSGDSFYTLPGMDGYPFWLRGLPVGRTGSVTKRFLCARLAHILSQEDERGDLPIPSQGVLIEDDCRLSW